MGRSSGSAPATIPSAGFYELVDATSSLPMDQGPNPGAIVRGAALRLSGAAGNPNFSGQLWTGGTGDAAVVDLGNKIYGYRITGGPGAYSGKLTSGISIPFRQDRTAAPVLPAECFRDYRHTLELVVWRPAGAAGILSVKLGADMFPMLGAFARAGFGLEHKASVGSTWRAIARKIEGSGTIEHDVDTGLDVTIPRKVNIIFEQTAAPTLTLKVAGASVLSIPFTDFPQIAYTGGQLAVCNENATATIDHFALSSYQIEEL